MLSITEVDFFYSENFFSQRSLIDLTKKLA